LQLRTTNGINTAAKRQQSTAATKAMGTVTIAEARARVVSLLEQIRVNLMEVGERENKGEQSKAIAQFLKRSIGQ
jgi:hypothetical protein